MEQNVNSAWSTLILYKDPQTYVGVERYPNYGHVRFELHQGLTSVRAKLNIEVQNIEEILGKYFYIDKKAPDGIVRWFSSS